MDTDEPDQPEGKPETRGTPEEIAVALRYVAELKVKAVADGWSSPAARLWRVENMKAQRLKLPKVRTPRPLNMALAKQTVAERIARRATLEAAGIVEDTARVLRAGVNVYGRIASVQLADYLRDRLANGDAKEKRWAAEQLMEVYGRSLDLLKMNREQSNRRRQAIATWPSEGEKS